MAKNLSPVPGYPDDNPKSVQGAKKTSLHLVPPSATIYTALGFEDGAVKYGPYNWRSKKVAATVYISAALRHLLDYLDGEDLARDSGKPHIAHALACLAIIADATETGNLVDDRPPKGASPDLLERWRKDDRGGERTATDAGIPVSTESVDVSNLPEHESTPSAGDTLEGWLVSPTWKGAHERRLDSKG